MSTSYDYKDAKADYLAHVISHPCNENCPHRARLRARALRIIDQWGLEPGDDERQRTQHHERIKYTS